MRQSRGRKKLYLKKIKKKVFKIIIKKYNNKNKIQHMYIQNL